MLCSVHDCGGDRIEQKARIGLCLDCEHARRIESDRGATFYLCELAESIPHFANTRPCRFSLQGIQVESRNRFVSRRF